MRVLVIESDRGGSAATVKRLEQAHHEVVTCRAAHDPPFPCRGMYGQCPVDEQHVDAAVLVRAHPWPKPTPLEQGATCAVRAKVPLVVTGKLVLDPFEEFAADVAESIDDLPAAVERAAATRWVRLAETVVAAVQEGLERHGLDPTSVRAEVRPRDADTWAVDVELRHQIGTVQIDDLGRRVVRALHQANPHPRTLAVVFADTEGGRMTARLG